MVMNRIMGKEAKKMQDYAREQIERAERRGISFPEDVKEDIFLICRPDRRGRQGKKPGKKSCKSNGSVTGRTGE